MAHSGSSRRRGRREIAMIGASGAMVAALAFGASVAAQSPAVTGDISYWHHFTEENEMLGLEHAEQVFETDNPGIVVTSETVPNPDYMTKMVTAVQAEPEAGHGHDLGRPGRRPGRDGCGPAHHRPGEGVGALRRLQPGHLGRHHVQRRDLWHPGLLVRGRPVLSLGLVRGAGPHPADQLGRVPGGGHRPDRSRPGALRLRPSRWCRWCGLGDEGPGVPGRRRGSTRAASRPSTATRSSRRSATTPSSRPSTTPSRRARPAMATPRRSRASRPGSPGCCSRAPAPSRTSAPG